MSAIDEMYTWFGPTPRICFDYLKTPSVLDGYIKHLRIALSRLSLRSLQKMVDNTSVLDMDAFSSTILLLKRRGSGLSRPLITVEPITPAVEMALRNQFRRETRAERLNLYHGEGRSVEAPCRYRLRIAGPRNATATEHDRTSSCSYDGKEQICPREGIPAMVL